MNQARAQRIPSTSSGVIGRVAIWHISITRARCTSFGDGAGGLPDYTEGFFRRLADHKVNRTEPNSYAIDCTLLSMQLLAVNLRHP